MMKELGISDQHLFIVCLHKVTLQFTGANKKKGLVPGHVTNQLIMEYEPFSKLSSFGIKEKY